MTGKTARELPQDILTDKACPVSGLPMLSMPEWTDIKCGKDYHLTLSILGGRILLSRPCGYGTIHDARYALFMTQKLAKENLAPDRPYIQVEDYRDLRGISNEARRYFIDSMRERENLWALIFCNAPPLIRFSIKFGKRLYDSEGKIHVVTDYAQAVRLAQSILSSGQSSPEPPMPEPVEIKHETITEPEFLRVEVASRSSEEVPPVEGSSPPTEESSTSLEAPPPPAGVSPPVVETPPLPEERPPTPKEEPSLPVLRLAETCPYTGLPIHAAPEWDQMELGQGFSASFKTIGDRILLTIPKGAPRKNAMEALSRERAKVIEAAFGPKRPFVEIRDYSRTLGKSFMSIRGDLAREARPLGDRTIAFIGFNPTVLMRLTMNTTGLLQAYPFPAFMMSDHESAMLKAVQVVERYNYLAANGKQETLSRSDWNLRLDDFSIRNELITGDILHGVSSGFLDEPHVPRIFESWDKVASAIPTPGSPLFLLIGLGKVQGGSRKARRLFTRHLMEWHQTHPVRMMIFYEANPLLRAATYLAGSFAPFKIRVARDFAAGLHLIAEEKTQSLGTPFQSSATAKQKRTLTREEVQPYIEELLNYLGSINWEKGGASSPEWRMDTEHPFRPVFDAISLIKMDLDDLFHEEEKAQEALRKSEERYRLHFESVNEVICSINQRMEVTDVSPSVKTFLGYSPEEIIGRPLKALGILPQEEIEVVFANAKRILSGEKMTSAQHTFIAKDGSRKFGEVSAAPLIRDGRIVSYTSVIRDITERKYLEEQLIESQRLEAVGRLAGGIAHDFNNMMTVVEGYSSMILMRLHQEDPQRKQVEAINKAGQHAARLTQQLLAFSRKQMLQPKVLNLDQVIAGMDKMLRRVIGEDIVLETLSGSGLWPIQADPGQIQQVILNLALNARDAMPRGGKLTIKTENILLEGAHLLHRGDLQAGAHVRLSLADTGLGMDEETRNRVFEPFFTTKEFGKGTGLGLATAYGIIKQTGGHIHVESAPGEGSTFHIYLPAQERLPKIEEPQVPTKSLPGGSETILVAEDEEPVRQFITNMLSMNGYHVLEARNGLEALTLCENHSGPIHLVLTDVVMPEMGGSELAERIDTILPGVKVLYMSGYAGDTVRTRGSLKPGTPFFEKPFPPESLLRKVRDVLDENSSGDS